MPPVRDCLTRRRADSDAVRTPTSQSDDRTVGSPHAQTQRLIDAHFESVSAYWTEIYEGDDVVAIICQHRRDLALAWIDELELPSESRILEVGCGAGLLAVELARKDFQVDATDTVAEMIDLTRQHAEQANVSPRVRPLISDVHALDFPDNTFDVVIALGVIPWLHSPEAAVHEITRVLKPGAHLVVTANNASRLIYLFDPIYNPALRPLKHALRRILDRLGIRGSRRDLPWRLHSCREFDALLSAASLQKVKGLTLGFGPFTFFGRKVLPFRLERRVHHTLQLLAERDIPGIRSLGAQYLVVARKVADAPR